MAFGFVKPVKTGNFKKDFKIFLKTLPMRMFGWHDIIKRIEFSDFKKFINLQKMENVLDIGAGNPPIYAIELAPYTNQYIAIDIADITYINNWNIPKELKTIQGSVYNLPFKDNTFDKIIISETMPLFDDQKKAISEISRVLKDNGKLFLINGSSLNTIKEIYKSKNFILRFIKYLGIKLKHIPDNYDIFNNNHTNLHSTNQIFFQDRESFLTELCINTPFQLIQNQYVINDKSSSLFQLIFFIYITLTGKRIQPKWFVIFYPLVKIFNNQTKSKNQFCIMTEIHNKKIDN